MNTAEEEEAREEAYAALKKESDDDDDDDDGDFLAKKGDDDDEGFKVVGQKGSKVCKNSYIYDLIYHFCCSHFFYLLKKFIFSAPRSKLPRLKRQPGLARQCVQSYKSLLLLVVKRELTWLLKLMS
jgi:hypothetical protein